MHERTGHENKGQTTRFGKPGQDAGHNTMRNEGDISHLLIGYAGGRKREKTKTEKRKDQEETSSERYEVGRRLEWEEPAFFSVCMET